MRVWSGVKLCVFIYGRDERLGNDDDAYEVEHDLLGNCLLVL